MTYVMKKKTSNASRTPALHRGDRRERFRRLAEKRVNRTIKDLQLIGNLSNRSNYEYTGEEVEKILRVLEAELRKVRQTFSHKGRSESPFSLTSE